VKAMATQVDRIRGEMTTELPEKSKCRWLKDILGLTDTEMAYTLGISVETLRKWLKDENDTHAMEAVRFHRLVKLTQMTKGVIRPSRLGHWIHHGNRALAGVAPLNLLADAAGCEMVTAVVEDVRMSISD
jgi:DNA-binding transcriptional regulator YiaG